MCAVQYRQTERTTTVSHLLPETISHSGSETSLVHTEYAFAAYNMSFFDPSLAYLSLVQTRQAQRVGGEDVEILCWCGDNRATLSSFHFVPPSTLLYPSSSTGLDIPRFDARILGE